MSSRSPKSHIHVEISERFADALKRAADRELMSVAALVRSTMAAKVREYGFEPAPSSAAPEARP
jgi:hypothetical protein